MYQTKMLQTGSISKLWTVTERSRKQSKRRWRQHKRRWNLRSQHSHRKRSLLIWTTRRNPQCSRASPKLQWKVQEAPCQSQIAPFHPNEALHRFIGCLMKSLNSKSSSEQECSWKDSIQIVHSNFHWEKLHTHSRLSWLSIWQHLQSQRRRKWRSRWLTDSNWTSSCRRNIKKRQRSQQIQSNRQIKRLNRKKTERNYSRVL